MKHMPVDDVTASRRGQRKPHPGPCGQSVPTAAHCLTGDIHRSAWPKTPCHANAERADKASYGLIGKLTFVIVFCSYHPASQAAGRPARYR
jgi:hypothetical protein